jgi:hypothetical protein
MASEIAPARTVLASLSDYAGLFPPARLELEDALAEYRRVRRSADGWIAGRFLVPASLLRELVACCGGRDAEPLPVAVVLDVERDARRWFADLQAKTDALAASLASEAVRLHAVEVPLPTPLAARETYDAPIAQAATLLRRIRADLPIAIEFPRDERAEERLPGGIAALARAGCALKLRCAAPTGGGVPPSASVAALLVELARAAVPLKATAGLHHPVRGRRDETGTVMHGFLNLLVATALAHGGAPHDHIVAALEDTDEEAFTPDGDGLRWRDVRIAGERAAALRARQFLGFGSCSLDEPLADLRALGFLAAATSV